MISTPMHRAKGEENMEKAVRMMLVVLLIGLCHASIVCKTDADCRRNVCIDQSCKPKSVAGGPCDITAHCLKPTDICKNHVCVSSSPAGGPCTSAVNCIVPQSTCSAQGICLSPTNGACSANNQCASPTETCIIQTCRAKSDAGGECDVGDAPADCSISSSTCPSSKCLSPTGGACNANDQCVSSSDSCIGQVCKAKSDAGGDCDVGDAPADCSISSSTCPSAKCLSPTGGTCNTNDQCASSSDSCIGLKCTVKSGEDGVCDLDDDVDCATGFSCDGTICSGQAPQISWKWQGFTAMPTARSSPASVVCKDFLFVLGGESPSRILVGTVEMYNPQNNSWVTKANMPLASQGHSAVCIGDFIFLIGGADINNQPFTSFFRYDTVNNVWSTASDYTQLPSPGLHKAAAAAVGNTIYLFGGRTSPSGSSVKVLTFVTTNPKGSWDNPTNLPVATYAASAVAVGNTIYITGGGGSSTFAFIYDTAAPAPTALPSTVSFKVQRAYHSSFFNPSDNKIYLVGVVSNADIPDFVETLDLGNPTAWVVVPSGNLGQRTVSPTVGTIGNRLYLAGSVDNYSPVVFALSFPPENNPARWVPFRPSRAPSFSSAVGKIGTSVLTVGGEGQVANAFTKVAKYDIISDSWTTLTPLLSPLRSAASAVVGSDMYIMGGNTNGGTSLKTTFSINLQGQQTSRPDLNVARLGACAASQGSKIYTYGGFDGSDIASTMEILDTSEPSPVWRDVTASASKNFAPTPSYTCAAVSTGTKILIIGGFSSAGLIEKVQSFDIATETWDAPLPAKSNITPRYSLSAVVLDGYVFITGGTTLVEPEVNVVEVFSIATGKVTRIADLPTPRSNHGSFTDGTSVYVVEGSGESQLPPIEKMSPPA